MTQCRFSRLVGISLNLVLLLAPAGWAEEGPCVVYPLKDLGNDPNLGKWLAETIPQVIQPGTWGSTTYGDGRVLNRTIIYYPQGKILVVCHHRPSVHTEIAAFLDGLKKALPAEKERTALKPIDDPKLLPVAFKSPDSPTTAIPQSPGYPVPAPLQQPKHLFHLIFKAEGVGDLGATGLVKGVTGADTASDEDVKKTETTPTLRVTPSITFILRYEGEGIIDGNVADVLKEIYGSKNAGKNGGDTAPATNCVPPLGALIGALSNIPLVPTTTTAHPLPLTRGDLRYGSSSMPPAQETTTPPARIMEPAPEPTPSPVSSRSAATPVPCR